MTSPTPAPSDLQFPDLGRIVAVDYGTVRIGFAICDPDRILASPLEVRPATAILGDPGFFRELARREKVAGFVVGLPIHCDGGESEKSLQCRRFARWLAEATSLPVRLFDERFTTTAATERLRGGNYTRKKTKQRIDAVAACVLLESYLEASRYLGDAAGVSVRAPATGGQGLD